MDGKEMNGRIKRRVRGPVANKSRLFARLAPNQRDKIRESKRHPTAGQSSCGRCRNCRSRNEHALAGCRLASPGVRVVFAPVLKCPMMAMSVDVVIIKRRGDTTRKSGRDTPAMHDVGSLSGVQGRSRMRARKGVLKRLE